MKLGLLSEGIIAYSNLRARLQNWQGVRYPVCAPNGRIAIWAKIAVGGSEVFYGDFDSADFPTGESFSTIPTNA